MAQQFFQVNYRIKKSVYISYTDRSMTTYNAGVCRFCFVQCYECSSVCTPYFTSPPMTARHISVFVCTLESCMSPFCVDLQPPLPAYLISVSVCTLLCLYVPFLCLFAMLNTAYIVLYLFADAHCTYIANFSLCLIGILLQHHNICTFLSFSHYQCLYNTSLC